MEENQQAETEPQGHEEPSGEDSAQETNGTPPRAVSLHEASDEELDALLAREDLDDYLDAFQKQQAEGAEQLEPEPEPEPDEKPADQKPPEDQSKQEPPAKKDGETGEKKDAVSKAPSKEQWEAVQKQLAHKELMIQRRGNEVGELRKKINEQNQLLDGKLEELWHEDPKTALEFAERIKQNKQTLTKEEAQQRQIEAEHRNAKLVTSALTPEEMDVDLMAAALERDGANPEAIAAFRSNPFRFNAETTIHLAKRAQSELKANALLRFAEKQRDKIKELEDKLNNGTERFANGVTNALKRSVSDTSLVGRASAKGNVNAVDPTQMTDKELETYLAQAKD